jgi:spermidine synthase
LIAAALIVLGSFLSFVIQPMAAKALLPSFGGAAAVWTAVLLFFQCSLVLGYCYAHFTRRALHAVVLIGAAVAVGIPSGTAALSGTDRPVWQVVQALTISIGAPFTVLASTSPLWQRWRGGRMPYRYYAFSNAASLLALLSYPVLIEPALDLEAQFRIWRWAFAAFAIVSLFALWQTPEDRPLTASWRILRPMWLIGPACGTLLLGSTTNQLCQEVASVPFLWVLPLAIYLTTFILVFHHIDWYRRTIFLWLAIGLIPASCVLVAVGLRVPFPLHLLTYCATLFVCLMICHGELVLQKPEPAGLTFFYIAIAAGGAAGGLLVTLGAPLLFDSYGEFPLSMALAAALGAVYSKSRRQQMGLFLTALVCFTALSGGGGGAKLLAEKRTFYGVLRVTESDGVRKLAHGATTHGTQFLDPARRTAATTYFGPHSGAALAIRQHPQLDHRSLHIGIVGLGAGTLSTYGRAGDQIDYFELDPNVETLARRWFTYLADSPAAVRVRIGDARVQLAALPPQQFDVLVVDAFSSDSIPIHLLTAEAGAIYRRHMAPGGRMAFHISNLTLDLEPVVAGLARRIGYRATRIEAAADPAHGLHASSWMLLDPAPSAPPRREVVWTDRYAALWTLLR